MPASYPTAVKTFTTKNAGDTIQPAHINDLQDEVVAIEQGLLGGVSPFQSSNSTLANLSVPGASTFTGNVQMDGTLTVNKIVSTSIAAAGVTSYVRATAGAVEFGASGVLVPYTTEIADLLGEWDSTACTFTPQSSGYYLVTAGAQTLALVQTNFAMRINSTIVRQVYTTQGGGNIWNAHELHGVFNLSSGASGRLDFYVWGDSSTGRTAANAYLEIIKLF